MEGLNVEVTGAARLYRAAPGGMIGWTKPLRGEGARRAPLAYPASRFPHGDGTDDILACREGQVTFRYREAKTGRMQRRTLPGPQFLWLVLQHVLPKGFRRARNFGFLHPNGKRLITLLQLLLKFVPAAASGWIKPRPPILCPGCGAVMKIVRTRIGAVMSKGPSIPLAARGAH